MPSYQNGNYKVIIFKDGTKIRSTKDNEFIPAFAENCDVKITDKCRMGCPWCYEGCTKEGKHADLAKYDFVDSLHPYTEMALNGNDLDHPQLEGFLEYLKEKKVYANITVHQNQLMNNFDMIKDWQQRGLIHGIGVSLNRAHDDLISTIKQLDNVVIHTIVGILTPIEIRQMANKDLKILVLGYKDLKRGIDFKSSNNEDIEENKKYLYDNLEDITKQFTVVSFDNLALEQLDVKRLLTEDEWQEFYMGDDGHYTFYIDMVKGEFARNSLSQVRYPIGNKTIDEMFQTILDNN